MRAGRASCLRLLLGAHSLACARALAAQNIDTIVVENRNVFEPRGEAPGWIARLGDALHRRTRPGVIRRALLFDRGEPYDSARAVESARALRALGVFRDVALDTARVNGRLAVRVTTSDGWSTRAEVGFASSAGSVTWTLGLVERNVLGTASALSAHYRKTPDRREWQLLGRSPGFLARRAVLGAGYLDLSDGRGGFWSYGVPFYRTSARTSLVTYGEAGRTRVLRFRDGALADSVERRVLRVGLSGGFALRATDRNYTRVRWIAQARREAFTALPHGGPQPDSTSFAAALGLELGSARFAAVEQLDRYARREDVDLTRRLWVGLWAAPRVFGYAASRAGLGPEIQAQWGTAWEGGFAWLRMNANGVMRATGMDSGRVELGATVMKRGLARHTLVLHAEGGVASAVAPGTEFDLWVRQNGPRAFTAHAFTGTRRYWVVAEDRILVAANALGLVGIGLAPFVEWGGAWYAGERPRAGGDVGLALRLGATRSTEGQVTEVAVAWRFGAGFTAGRWALVIRPGLEFRQ